MSARRELPAWSELYLDRKKKKKHVAVYMYHRVTTNVVLLVRCYVRVVCLEEGQRWTKGVPASCGNAATANKQTKNKINHKRTKAKKTKTEQEEKVSG